MNPATRSAPSGIDAFLISEHREFDHVLADVEFLSKRRSFTQAAKRFGEFRRRIEWHLDGEEQILLPLLVERTGDPGGVASRIHLEHEELRRLLDAAASSISQWDYPGFCRQLESLGVSLRAHHASEERLLHPALDALVQSEADWVALLREARARPGSGSAGLPFPTAP
jgi:transcriptional regulator of acetoin/glycerol metabolism